MKKNIGTFDRVIRLLIGIILLVGIFYVDSTLGKVIVGIVGLFCLYEALKGWCAFYALIGKNTCPIK